MLRPTSECQARDGGVAQDETAGEDDISPARCRVLYDSDFIDRCR